MSLYSKKPKDFENRQFEKNDISSIIKTVVDYCNGFPNTLNKNAIKAKKRVGVASAITRNLECN